MGRFELNRTSSTDGFQPLDFLSAGSRKKDCVLPGGGR
jgi:hypothetical protein